jgi:hypothetical protein
MGVAQASESLDHTVMEGEVCQLLQLRLDEAEILDRIDGVAGALERQMGADLIDQENCLADDRLFRSGPEYPTRHICRIRKGTRFEVGTPKIVFVRRKPLNGSGGPVSPVFEEHLAKYNLNA